MKALALIAMLSALAFVACSDRATDDNNSADDGGTDSKTNTANNNPEKDASTESNTNSTGTETIEAFCAAQVAYAERCSKKPEQAFVQCDTMIQGVLTRFKPEALEAYTKCSATVACGTDDDCFEAMLKAVAPDFLGDPDFLQCNSKREGCSSAKEPTFSDDLCMVILLLTDAHLTLIKECYDRSCAEMKGCVESLVDLDFG